MTTRDSHEQQNDPQNAQSPSRPSRKDSADDVQLSDEGREEVRQILKAYEDKPTVELPGTHGAITGTAINEWLDDEGNPKFGDTDGHPSAEDEDHGDDPEQTLSSGG
ncbi:hypothetical protein [Mycobacterium sp.]|uniref:hypothetical protein n=1 Tax=Mycobacterium sp. TaxID=1785 RepID=UPI0031D2ED6E